MGVFKPAVLTQAGAELLAKVHARELSLTFTKAQTGAGVYYDDEDVTGVTALRDARQTFGFECTKILNRTDAMLRFIVTNMQTTSNLAQGYDVTEVGIFARDPDAGEILYAICLADSHQHIDYMPAYNGSFPITITMEFYVKAANAQSVTFTTSGDFVSMETFEERKDEVDGRFVEIAEVGTAAKYAEKLGGKITAQDIINAVKIINRTYEGVDLTVKFADEIAGALYNGDEWAWIKGRIQAANYEGIWVRDYIPFSAGGYNFKAEAAGIDTYYMYGDEGHIVGHHIDFICRELWPEKHRWNIAYYNNGTTVSPAPYLASDIYHYLNSLQGQVPTTATANPTLTAVDYRTTGVYSKLPQTLKNVIVQKRMMLSTRYTAGSLLTDDNGYLWADMGYLWLPSEVEVYGVMNYSKISTSAPPDFANGADSVQYPLFANNMHRIKAPSGANADERSGWWLCNSSSGKPFITIVHSWGSSHATHAGLTNVCAPLCFRVA